MENKKDGRESAERIKYEISQEMGLSKPEKPEKKEQKNKQKKNNKK